MHVLVPCAALSRDKLTNMFITFLLCSNAMLSHSLGCLKGQMFFSAFKHSLISMVDMLGMVLYDGCIKLNSVTFSELTNWSSFTKIQIVCSCTLNQSVHPLNEKRMTALKNIFNSHTWYSSTSHCCKFHFHWQIWSVTTL